MTSVLLAVVYLTALQAGLWLGSTSQRAATVVIAILLLTRLAVRHHRPMKRGASSIAPYATP